MYFVIGRWSALILLMATSPKKKNTSNKNKPAESDSGYFLKLVMYLIIGSLWVKINYGDASQIPIPAGLIIGLIFARHEIFQLDRKIEYALLLLAAFVGFWLPIGIFVSL